jgi:hypothetical protein
VTWIHDVCQRQIGCRAGACSWFGKPGFGERIGGQKVQQQLGHLLAENYRMLDRVLRINALLRS